MLLKHPCYECEPKERSEGGCILARNPKTQLPHNVVSNAWAQKSVVSLEPSDSGNVGQYYILTPLVNLVAVYNPREYPTVSDHIDNTAYPQAEENGFPQKFYSVGLAEPQCLCPYPAHQILDR